MWILESINTSRPVTCGRFQCFTAAEGLKVWTFVGLKAWMFEWCEGRFDWGWQEERAFSNFYLTFPSSILEICVIPWDAFSNFHFSLKAESRRIQLRVLGLGKHKINDLFRFSMRDMGKMGREKVDFVLKGLVRCGILSSSGVGTKKLKMTCLGYALRMFLRYTLRNLRESNVGWMKWCKNKRVLMLANKKLEEPNGAPPWGCFMLLEIFLKYGNHLASGLRSMQFLTARRSPKSDLRG